eukprot:6052111-Alexandrium_andersonii.AAC.1
MLNCTRTQAAVRPAGVRHKNCTQTRCLQALGTRTARPNAHRGACGPTTRMPRQRPEAVPSTAGPCSLSPRACVKAGIGAR